MQKGFGFGVLGFRISGGSRGWAENPETEQLQFKGVQALSGSFFLSRNRAEACRIA